MFNSKQARKVKIAKVAIKLIKERGYIGLSFNELAKESGVPSGTLYRTFESKDDLLAFLFGITIRNLGDSMQRFYKLELSAKERLICFSCYQFFIRMKYPEDGFLDLVGTNRMVFHNAEPEARAKFQSLFDELRARHVGMFFNLVKKGVVKDDISLISKVIRQLMFLSRGGVFIANHMFIDQSEYELEDLVDACCLILNQLQWASAEDRVDYRQIRLALMSEMEQSKTLDWNVY